VEAVYHCEAWNLDRGGVLSVYVRRDARLGDGQDTLFTWLFYTCAIAIASSVPTNAPDAAEVALRLAARQYGIQTCGWINADHPLVRCNYTF
jgi:hypothetical protein